MKASAFAPSQKGGRTLSWESLAKDTVGGDHNLVFNNLAFTAGGSDIRYLVLLPPNVLRGTLTLVRTKITWETWWGAVAIGTGAGSRLARMPWNMQLVPVRDGAIQDAAVLDPDNAADDENNAIIARGLRFAELGQEGTLNSLERVPTRQPIFYDVKSQRRFDRSLWALILVTTALAGTTSDMLHALDVRALFKAPDGV